MGQTIVTGYLTLEQAAQFLNCNPLSVRRMIARGELKARRYGRLIRIDPADLAKAGRPVTTVKAAA